MFAQQQSALLWCNSATWMKLSIHYVSLLSEASLVDIAQPWLLQDACQLRLTEQEANEGAGHKLFLFLFLGILIVWFSHVASECWPHVTYSCPPLKLLLVIKLS